VAVVHAPVLSASLTSAVHAAIRVFVASHFVMLNLSNKSVQLRHFALLRYSYQGRLARYRHKYRIFDGILMASSDIRKPMPVGCRGFEVL
jgi:hypothetical protein